MKLLDVSLETWTNGLCDKVYELMLQSNGVDVKLESELFCNVQDLARLECNIDEAAFLRLQVIETTRAL